MNSEDLLSKLNRDGYVHIPAQQQTSWRQFLGGKLILTSEVKVVENAQFMVQSAEPMDWHQDSPEAKWIAWSCLCPGEQNEVTELLDGRPVLSNLSSETLDTLGSVPVRNLSDDPAQSYVPLLRRQGDLLKTYYCPWLTELSGAQKQEAALLEFKKGIQLRSNSVIQIHWQQDDLLIIDNHRMLHKRGRLAASSQRHLRRYWISE